MADERTLIHLAQDDLRFHVRVAGVCILDGHVLLEAASNDNFWVLPGGHGELFEPTDRTVYREMFEEFGVEVVVGRLLWVVENFFVTEDIRTHQIAFLYDVHLPEGCELLDVTKDYEGSDEGIPFVARWFPIASLGETQLVPSFLREALNDIPASPKHLVHVDRQE